MSLLSPDYDRNRVIADRRARERDLRLAKRDAIRKGDRAGALEIAEYGRKNGIDQRGIRRSEEVMADADATVQGMKSDLAISQEFRRRAEQRLLNSPVTPPAAGGTPQPTATQPAPPAPMPPPSTSAQPSPTPTSSPSPSPGRTELAPPTPTSSPSPSPSPGGLGEAELNAVDEKGRRIFRNPADRGTEISTNAPVTPVQRMGIKTDLKLAPPEGSAAAAAAAKPAPPTSPVKDIIAAAEAPKVSAPTASPPAANQGAEELILNRGEKAPAGYTLVGMSSGRYIYRNDPETKAAEAAAAYQTYTGTGAAAKREALSPVDRMDPTTKAYYLQAQRDTAAAPSSLATSATRKTRSSVPASSTPSSARPASAPWMNSATACKRVWAP